MVLDALLPHQCLDFVDQLMEAESAEKSRIHDPEFGKPDINKENIPTMLHVWSPILQVKTL